MIIQIVMILFPGIIAADCYVKNYLKSKEIKDFIVYTAIFSILINAVQLYSLYSKGWINHNFNYMGPVGIVKYMGLGFVLAYLFPHLYHPVIRLFRKYISGNVEKTDDM